ncbi:MAG: glycosyltransferase family 4 protein [Chlorobi bacterium]|nr:glycosyltransferase family 4 protein [Chlorobiota bacterium]
MSSESADKTTIPTQIFFTTHIHTITTTRLLRIATICFSGTVGGLELATLRRAAELQGNGHHVISILPNSAAILEQAKRLGITATAITPRFSYLDILAARKLRKILDREEIDLLLVARTRDLSTAMLAAGTGRAVVLYQQMQFGQRKKDVFHNWVYRRLDGCVGITHRQRDQFIRLTNLAPEKISVVPYGIHADHFSPTVIPASAARAEMGIPDTAFLVGIVGGFNPGKGQREFLEGVRLAWQEAPSIREHLWAVLVGERPTDVGQYTTDLRALRDSLPFRERVLFRPFLNDPRTAYAGLDVFILASHSETFGMVLQEAMAMGVACIGTDAGGVPEIIAHEERGLLIAPNNPKAIADAMLRLFHNPELRQTLAANARQFVLRAYDSQKQYVAFQEALEQAAARRIKRR